MFGIFTKSPKTPAASTASAAGWVHRLRSGLSHSRKKLQDSLKGLFGAPLDDAWFETLEDALISADVGVKTSSALIAQ